MCKVRSIRHARVRYEVRVHGEGAEGEFSLACVPLVIPLLTDLISGHSLVVCASSDEFVQTS